MKRRWFIRGLFILPILLCVGGWVWSMTHLTTIVYAHSDFRASCELEYGTVGLEWGHYDPTTPLTQGCYTFAYSMRFRFVEPDFFRWSNYSFLGFKYWQEWHTHYNLIGIHVPFWFPIALFSAILFFVWRKTRPKINSKTAFPVQVKSQSV